MTMKKRNYVVRTTTYCVDGSHVTHWVNFGTDLLGARCFEARERNRKLLPRDVRRDVRLLMMEA